MHAEVIYLATHIKLTQSYYSYLIVLSKLELKVQNVIHKDNLIFI